MLIILAQFEFKNVSININININLVGSNFQPCRRSALDIHAVQVMLCQVIHISIYMALTVSTIRIRIVLN